MGVRLFYEGHHKRLTGLMARCSTCGHTVAPLGGFQVPYRKTELDRSSRCPVCRAFPATWTWELGSKPDVLTDIDEEPAGFVRACDVCGKRTPNMVEAMAVTGVRVIFCRHGHFHGEVVDPVIGLVSHVTGPVHVDALLWWPEGWVTWLAARMWEET